MKSKWLVLVAAGLFSCIAGFVGAQELRQGVPVSPSSVYVYEIFDLYKQEVKGTSEQTILSVAGNRAKIQEVKNGQKMTRWLDITSHSMPWSHTQGVKALIRFPSTVGDTWDWTASEAVDGNGDRNVRYSWEVSAKFIGWEDVEVPAGKFRAAKIEHTGFWKLSTDGRGARIEIIVWYSPDVGRVVKLKEVDWIWNGIDSQIELRLTKYQPAPGAVVGLVRAD